MVATASSLTGGRTLVLLDNLENADIYMDFWTDLQDRDYNVTLHDVNLPMSLTKHDVRLFDNLLIMSPKMK
ncbi:hypothetical protein BGW38_006257, partial [Lunasporangiospora selenospora]